MANLEDGIRKMVIGSLIAEFGNWQVIDNTRQDLKKLVQKSIKANRDVQDYILNHSLGSKNPNFKAVRKHEFLKDEQVLIAELFDLIHGFNAESLEIIIEAIKANSSEKL